jgi:two-component system, sensor histidine kinase SagS
MSFSRKEPNKRILIVDDEADVLDFLRIYLGSLGWEVTLSSSTADAFVLLDTQTFFLVITDIAMPEMDGYEFISRMKDLAIPSEVVLMTGFGYNPKHTLIKIYKTIRYPCLFKPFNRSKLSEAVKTAYDLYHKEPPPTQPVTPPAPESTQEGKGG